ncbi:phosphatidate cytidylyltransferase [Gymnodinialimonas sp.]
MALSELTERTLSAAVMLPVAVGALVMGGIWFWALAVVIVAIAAGEWACLHGACVGEDKLDLPATVLAAVAPLFLILFNQPITYALSALLLGSLIVAALSALGNKPVRIKMAAGSFYCGMAGLALVWLRDLDDPTGVGLVLVLFVLVAVWATDIGAYFGGRTIGGPKIAPKISPKKTWAGLISGSICAAICGAAVAHFTTLDLHPALAAVMAAILAILAQAGDFLESHLKRVAGKKDSSNLIPGHGGVLDRIDGILPTAPLMALIWLTMSQ